MTLRDLIDEHLVDLGYPVAGANPRSIPHSDFGWMIYFKYNETFDSILELQIVGGFRRVTIFYRSRDRWLDTPELDSYDPDFFNKLTDYIADKYGPPKTLSSS